MPLLEHNSSLAGSFDDSAKNVFNHKIQTFVHYTRWLWLHWSTRASLVKAAGASAQHRVRLSHLRLTNCKTHWTHIKYLANRKLLVSRKRLNRTLFESHICIWCFTIACQQVLFNPVNVIFYVSKLKGTSGKYGVLKDSLLNENVIPSWERSSFVQCIPVGQLEESVLIKICPRLSKPQMASWQAEYCTISASGGSCTVEGRKWGFWSLTQNRSLLLWHSHKKLPMERTLLLLK